MALGKGVFRAPRGAIHLKHFIDFPAGQNFYRVQHESHQSSIFFDRVARHRFNAPAGQYGTCYLGTTPEAALVESILHHYTTASGIQKPVFLSEVQRLRLWKLTLRHPIRLIDFNGVGLARNQIDLQIATGPHKTARAWSLAIWSHAQAVDGIHYPSRHNNECACAAVYDRAQAKVHPSYLFREYAYDRLVDPSRTTILPAFNAFISKYRIPIA
jgi:hypothetical protein